MPGAGAVTLFADYKEKSDIANSRRQQTFGGYQHGGDDALGIAGSPAPNEFIVLARRNERRNRIHVGRESDMGFAETGENIPAVRLDFESFDDAVVVRANPRETGAYIPSYPGFSGGRR